MAEHDLIQCADHQWAPWSVVCIHLCQGTSRQWEGLDSNNPEVDHDWLCPACMKEHMADQDNLDHLRPVCIHCVRKLRKMYDPNFKEEYES